MPLRQLPAASIGPKMHAVGLDQRQCLAPYDRRIDSIARGVAFFDTSVAEPPIR